MHEKALKQKAIDMRKSGMTYREILKEIKVAKSTLTEWFYDVGLAKRQVQAITRKRIEGAQRGADARKRAANELRESIYAKARSEIGELSDKEIWLVATALYWAEGSKEKMRHSGSGCMFANSDPRMLSFFLYWIIFIHKISLNRIKFELYIHKSSEQRIDVVYEYWSKTIGLNKSNLILTSYKTHEIKAKYTELQQSLYYGLIRVKVLKSSALVRELEGWAQGLTGYVDSQLMHAE